MFFPMFIHDFNPDEQEVFGAELMDGQLHVLMASGNNAVCEAVLLNREDVRFMYE